MLYQARMEYLLRPRLAASAAAASPSNTVHVYSFSVR
jgi:hypothetical protein